MRKVVSQVDKLSVCMVTVYFYSAVTWHSASRQKSYSKKKIQKIDYHRITTDCKFTQHSKVVQWKNMKKKSPFEITVILNMYVDIYLGWKQIFLVALLLIIWRPAFVFLKK